ncbi:MAG: hypothetical protein WBQ73_00095 [Candidatus Babeliales bacterium]
MLLFTFIILLTCVNQSFFAASKPDPVNKGLVIAAIPEYFRYQIDTVNVGVKTLKNDFSFIKIQETSCDNNQVAAKINHNDVHFTYKENIVKLRIYNIICTSGRFLCNDKLVSHILKSDACPPETKQLFSFINIKLSKAMQTLFPNFNIQTSNTSFFISDLAQAIKYHENNNTRTPLSKDLSSYLVDGWMKKNCALPQNSEPYLIPMITKYYYDEGIQENELDEMLRIYYYTQ